MDFPFEYVERVIDYPSFDHHVVTKQVLDEDIEPKPKVCSGSEEEEKVGNLPVGVVNEKEKALIDQIRRIEKHAVKIPLCAGCSSSDSADWDSVGDTSETDAVEALYETDAARERVQLKKMKIMRTCCCTESECKSNSELTISTSSSSTSTSSEDGVPITDEKAEAALMSVMSRMVSSDESFSSSDEEMNIDEEIQYLEEMLKEIEKAEDRRGKENSDSEDSEKERKMKEFEDMFEEQTSKTQTNSKSCENSAQEPSTAAEPTDAPPSTDSSTTPANSEVSVTDSIGISSSDADVEARENDLERFNWQSDDLYGSTDTDSDLEKHLDALGKAMHRVESTFANSVVIGETVPLLKEKLKHFPQPLPTVLPTKNSYEVLEQQEKGKPNADITKQLWLVQQLGSGCMCSAKLVSRKNPDHLQLQKHLDRERRLLYELLPELSKPSHIAKLVDAGFNDDFKYLIYEDLGMDLITFFEEFGPRLTSATRFLITYFSFNAIKELHSLDIVHCDIRPSSFNIIHHPFNIKLVDYSRCIKKKPHMKSPDDVKPDSFTPRVFHQKDTEFDQFVDFEGWIYAMIHLCAGGLPWFQDPTNMLELKEHFFHNPDYEFDECGESVPMAITLIRDKTVTYDGFLETMSFYFSVDVMQYPDKTQPRLWSLKELAEVMKNKRPDSEEENDFELAESHWNPLNESDSEDGKNSEVDKTDKESKKQEEAARKSKFEKKSQLKEDETQQMSQSEMSSNSEQWSEASSADEARSNNQKNKKGGKLTPPKRGVPERLMEPSSTEQCSMPSNMPRKNIQNPNQPIAKQEKKRKEAVKFLEPPTPKAAPGKKNRRRLVTREFLFEMNKDLNGSESSISSDSSATSFSSWTTSTWSSDDDGEKKKRYKWSENSSEGSGCDFLEDLDSDEMETHRQYEHLVACYHKDQVRLKPASESDPLSDIDSDEKNTIIQGLAKRKNEAGFEEIDKVEKWQEAEKGEEAKTEDQNK